MVGSVSNSVVSSFQRLDEQNRHQENKKTGESKAQSGGPVARTQESDSTDRQVPVARASASNDDTTERAATRQRGSLLDIRV